METDVKTYRGRTLEELLPQIREELGSDAIVLRRREGLAGGIGGFFQKQFVEVDARAALPDERPLEARNDRATEEGLATPGVQALVAGAAPFADALLAATAAAVIERPAPAEQPEFEPFDAGLYGPQPRSAATSGTEMKQPATATLVAGRPASPADGSILPERATSGGAPGDGDSAGRSSATRSVPQPSAPASATTAENRLVEGGLTQSLAADIVGEAVTHGLPFAQPKTLKKLIRAALARRIPVMADLGPEPRTIAFVGAGGAGKSSAVAHLATAYAAAGASVTVVAHRQPDGGAALRARLEPLGVTVLPGAPVAGGPRSVVTLIDTPVCGPADPDAVAALALELRALGAGEVHLALPATLSAPAAEELAAALRPLGLTHLALTHADQTARPGAAVELAIALRRPLSYRCDREVAAPADPATLAQVLLP